MPVATLLLRSRMFAVAVLTLAAVDMGLIGGNTALVAAAAEQTNGDQLASPSSDSGKTKFNSPNSQACTRAIVELVVYRPDYTQN